MNITQYSSSLLILSLIHFFQACHANCTPSACGLISNISSPFRLKGDPKKCGDSRFQLECENNVASIDINSIKYYVKAINYSRKYYTSNGNFDTYTIRLVDASINNDDICSFPIYSACDFNFTFNSPYGIPISSTSPSDYIPTPINLMRCPHPLNNSSFFTEITADCASNDKYTYIKVGHLNASEVTETCAVDLVVMTSWIFKDLKSVSLSEIHDSLLYGFELTVCPSCAYPFSIRYSLILILVVIVIAGLLCAAVSPPLFTILGFAAMSILVYLILPLIFDFKETSSDPGVLLNYFSMMVCVPRIIIFPLAVWFFIYKFRRRRLSTFEGIESFLQSDNKLVPIRYSYADIKKMSRGFQDKLGEGGYGSVYKGKLRSGRDVAVKLLSKSGSNGQDFMNEIATIGRIHHVNVVKLVGYCAQGSKRALVFDFMPNGSLEKYLFNRENMSFLNWETKFEVAVGVARGIEYLHRGCDVQILHFDIKPHNILLDDNFIPKISDFGLAKLCSADKKSVTMTTARGTIGYVAPELISRSIGAVSYKADVYSFGMLLIEMVGLNRDMKGKNDESSKYFPCWIYDRFNQGVEIEIEKAEESNGITEENESSTRNILVRKMTIVALWCIQMNPDDRPSMNEVLQMLEGDVERLQIPEYPSQSTQIQWNVDESGITCWSDSVSLLRHDDASIRVEISVQE